jgi:hypothetical protein
MAENITESSNVHALPTDIYRNESDKGNKTEDEYDRGKRELLVDMDAEEEKDPDIQSEKKMTYLAAGLLAVIMVGSYVGYDWYQQYKINESVTAIAAIEAASSAPQTIAPKINTDQPINDTVEKVTPPSNEITVADTANNLFNLINTATPENISPQEKATESTSVPSPASLEVAAAGANQPVNVINAPNNVPNNAIASTSLDSLRTTIGNLTSVTENLKASMSEMTFQLDQNTQRMTQAVYRIEALEKKAELASKSITPSDTTPKKVASKTISRQQWIDQAKVVSIRKIGASFIAKINISGDIKRMTVGDRHEQWMVQEIELDAGKIHFTNQQNKQQRTLFL